MRLRLLATLGLLALASPALADTAAQFDLVCTGKVKDIIKSTEEPFTTRLSVDLTTGTFSFTGAAQTQPIVSVDRGMITFLDHHSRSELGEGTEVLKVSRDTGSYSRQSIMGVVWAQYSDGTCEPAAFTPFPKTKF